MGVKKEVCWLRVGDGFLVIRLLLKNVFRGPVWNFHLSFLLDKWRDEILFSIFTFLLFLTFHRIYNYITFTQLHFFEGRGVIHSQRKILVFQVEPVFLYKCQISSAAFSCSSKLLKYRNLRKWKCKANEKMGQVLKLTYNQIFREKKMNPFKLYWKFFFSLSS